MYRVLMPVDKNEERGMAQARHVATLPDAENSVEVTLLHVFDDDDSISPATDEDVREPESVDSVARVIEFLESEGIQYRTQTDLSDPVQAIVEHAEDIDAESIVLGGRKRSPAGKILFGSATMSVLRNTDIPVVVTGAAE